MKRAACLASALALAAAPAFAQQATFPPAPGTTSFANPTGTVGASAVNGSASTAMRSDAAPALAPGAAAANLGFTPPSISGSITTGDCPKWISATQLGDSGGPCGSAGSSLGANTFTARQTINDATANDYSLVFGPATLTSGGTGFGEDIVGTVNDSTAVDGVISYANITCTACATGTNLVDWLVGGGSVFKLTYAGALTLGAGIVVNGGVQVATTATLGWSGRATLASSNAGHVAVTTGGAPAVSACGTSFAIDTSYASDMSGQVTFGTGSPTSCTVTFYHAFTTWNHCVVTFETANTSPGYSYSKTAITITGSALTGIADYRCEGS